MSYLLAANIPAKKDIVARKLPFGCETGAMGTGPRAYLAHAFLASCRTQPDFRCLFQTPPSVDTCHNRCTPKGSELESSVAGSMLNRNE